MKRTEIIDLVLKRGLNIIAALFWPVIIIIFLVSISSCTTGKTVASYKMKRENSFHKATFGGHKIVKTRLKDSMPI